MKKLFFIPLVALAICSCNKNLTQGVQKENGPKAISFSSYLQGSTRAVNETTSESLKTSGFAVQITTIAQGKESVLYAMEDYSWDDTNSYFKAPVMRYWPADENASLYIYAINVPSTTAQVLNTNYTTSASITLSPSTTEQGLYDAKGIYKYDLVGTKKVAKWDDTNKTTALTFKHLFFWLDKISFTGENLVAREASKFKYEISEVELTCYTEATFTYPKGSEEDITNSWGDHKGYQTFKYINGGAALVVDKDNTSKEMSFGYFLPFTKVNSEGANNCALKVTYKVYDMQNIDQTTHEPQVLFTGSKVATLPTWEMGQKVAYNVTLSSDARPITFTATVAAWTDQTDNTNINL
ncbi:MAG: fimbrillin family protein [Bacteroidales bacterium]|nr:fimbrillin family protein [Bacteroidales bacterium]